MCKQQRRDLWIRTVSPYSSMMKGLPSEWAIAARLGMKYVLTQLPASDAEIPQFSGYTCIPSHKPNQHQQKGATHYGHINSWIPTWIVAKSILGQFVLPLKSEPFQPLSIQRRSMLPGGPSTR